MSIKTLRQRFSWPEKKPGLLFDRHGMMTKENEQMLSRYIKEGMVVVELGSWIGKSTRFILSLGVETIICVDTWKGSKELYTMQKPHVQRVLPILFEQFCSNQWNQQDKIIPIRSDSVVGLKVVYEEDVKPDVVYIDASHEYPDVLMDLYGCYALFPQAIILGDDWCPVGEKRGPLEFPGVVQAVEDFRSAMGSTYLFSQEDITWTLEPN